jgi:hypothetical protein
MGALPNHTTYSQDLASDEAPARRSRVHGGRTGSRGSPNCFNAVQASDFETIFDGQEGDSAIRNKVSISVRSTPGGCMDRTMARLST